MHSTFNQDPAQAKILLYSLPWFCISLWPFVHQKLKEDARCLALSLSAYSLEAESLLVSPSQLWEQAHVQPFPDFTWLLRIQTRVLVLTQWMLLPAEPSAQSLILHLFRKWSFSINNMTQQTKALATQTWRPDFNPLNLCKSGGREPTPQIALWPTVAWRGTVPHSNTHVHIHTHKYIFKCSLSYIKTSCLQCLLHLRLSHLNMELSSLCSFINVVKDIQSLISVVTSVLRRFFFFFKFALNYYRFDVSASKN